MGSDADELSAQYAEALKAYLRCSGEAQLQRAYELGRRAVGMGLGVLHMSEVHHAALSAILKRPSNGKVPELAGVAALTQRAGEFFTESMSPFEMTHRAFGEANAALKLLNRTLEEEARRIAHVLHDEAGQLLAVVHIRLDQIGWAAPPEVHKELEGVRDLLHQVEVQLRRISHEWRPTILDDRGLMPALAFLAEGVSKRTKLEITLQELKGERLPAQLETALYRTVQEALNNAARHAHASRVWIKLRRQEGILECSVRDDGMGFDAAKVMAGKNGGGLGLTGMRERLSALGGTLRIESARNRGTELQVTVPLPK